MANTFHCTMVTPERQLLDEAVTYASIPAHDGQMGIAPQRGAAVVKLSGGALRLDFTEGGSRWFYVGDGFAQVKDNRLDLMTEEAIPAEDIVKNKVEQTLEETREVAARTDEEVRKKYGAIERARTLLTLHDRYGNKL